MKKNIALYFLILSSFVVQGSSGNYHPLPDSNATWKLDFYADPAQCPPFGYCYSINVTIVKDTIIGAYTYHLTDYPTPFSYPAYREDTVSKKVFFPLEVVPGIVRDTLLFDFNLQIGDTITQVIPGLFQGHQFKATTIDSIFNGAYYLRRWTITDITSGAGVSEIVEGVGNLRGLFGEFSFFESAFSVNCMIKDGQSFFPDATGVCSLVSVSNTELRNEAITLFPNPVHSDGIVEMRNSSSSNKVASVRITDLIGNVITVARKPFQQIDLAGIVPGLYIFKIELGNESFVMKPLVIY